MVDIDWPVEFGTWLDRLETDARAGDQRARTVLVFVARALDQLRNLPEPPARESETATLRWVRQSRRYPLWRVSHAYHPQAAVRLICWFPPDTAQSSLPYSPPTRPGSGTCSMTGSPLAPIRWWTSGSARRPTRRSHE
jgi:hypothetical protein